MLLFRYSTAVICAVFIVTGAVSGQDEKKAVLGGTVSFSPAKIDPPVNSIIWKHRNSETVVKAIEWDDEGFNTPNQRFKHITTLNEKTGEITITNLTINHTGRYTIDINSKEQAQFFILTVMERVRKPVIEIERSSNPDVVYLRCGYNETMIWKNSTGETLQGTKNHLLGETITVKNTRNPGNYYTCTLKNAVSEETSDPVFERDLFDESNAGHIVGIIIGVLLLLIFIIFLCVYLFMESFHKSVNNCCPCIESAFGPLDCCLKMRQQYNVAPSDNNGAEEKGNTDKLELGDHDVEVSNGPGTKGADQPLKSPSDAENVKGVYANDEIEK
ncbi:uncharacterized protein LOC107717914 [Sinocyclocheilus rhinocerous]|uniref:uncharacterized protein LOC107717914 n=1 Tax=Sinocyclocheilus rhinocerous TaxID=307959 RepID=UPI0007B8CC23|nr:PREDICTED: uncharacterized protein LOC107717914 [Sinocyclocheilus rhinocerous]